MSIFQKFRDTLQKTRQNIAGKVFAILTGRPQISEETFQELEEALISADVGPATSIKLVEEVRKAALEGRQEGQDVSAALQEAVARILEDASGSIEDPTEKPLCILVVGVNGDRKSVV